MKKRILTLAIVAACAATTANAATSSSTGNCGDRRIQAMKKMTKGASEVYDDTIKTPDLSFIEQCLGQIKQPRFGFGLSFPSVGDLLSQVCNMMQSKINEAISGLDYSFDANGFGNGYGSGSSSRQVSYSSDTGSFHDQYGPVTSSTDTDTYSAVQTPPFNAGAESGSVQTGTMSNSTYMENTINNAMRYLTGR